MMATEVRFLELDKYADTLVDFDCEVSLKDLLELVEDIHFVNHMCNVVLDEDFGYNDQVQFIDQFGDFLGRGECTLHRENADWDLDLFDYDHMVVDFATFTNGTNRFVLRLEEMGTVMADYGEKIDLLEDKYSELS